MFMFSPKKGKRGEVGESRGMRMRITRRGGGDDHSDYSIAQKAQEKNETGHVPVQYIFIYERQNSGSWNSWNTEERVTDQRMKGGKRETTAYRHFPFKCIDTHRRHRKMGEKERTNISIFEDSSSITISSRQWGENIYSLHQKGSEDRNTRHVWIEGPKFGVSLSRFNRLEKDPSLFQCLSCQTWSTCHAIVLFDNKREERRTFVLSAFSFPFFREDDLEVYMQTHLLERKNMYFSVCPMRRDACHSQPHTT